VSFVATTLRVASQRVFIVVSVYFVTESVRKRLDIPSYDLSFSRRQHDLRNVGFQRPHYTAQQPRKLWDFQLRYSSGAQTYEMGIPMVCTYVSHTFLAIWTSHILCCSFTDDTNALLRILAELNKHCTQIHSPFIPLNIHHTETCSKQKL